MRSKINELLKNIDDKKNEIFSDLQKEYENLKGKYGYTLKKKKVIFSKKVKKHNKIYKDSVWKEFLTGNMSLRHVISMPFIYGMIIPVLFLDLFLFLYQQTAFRLYGIPLVKRSDYIIYDRRFLSYLNWIEKFHCLYCSYVNGVFSYSVEVAGRTEKYWCPIKNSMKMKGGHYWQKYFADYGDPEGYKEALNNGEIFLQDKEESA